MAWINEERNEEREEGSEWTERRQSEVQRESPVISAITESWMGSQD